ncbi:MAG TPA: hypothetical protein VGN97_16335 [Mesorhizobium sp.]|nr:hypothetical protein [Mesorhizobium sp.]
MSEIAGQVRSAASGVAASVSDKAQDVVSNVSDEFEHVINERKDEGAQRLHSLAGAMGRASSELQEEFPLVASYVKRGASKLDTLAETIREQDARTLAAQAGEVARRRAGTIAGLMGLVGFAAVRFLMARPSASGASDWDEGDGDERGTSEVVQESLQHLAEMGEAAASGDPGGVSPVAPGFEDPSDTGQATREAS